MNPYETHQANQPILRGTPAGRPRLIRFAKLASQCSPWVPQPADDTTSCGESAGSWVVGSDIAHAVPLTLIAGIGHWVLGSVNWLLL
jgi:hypothetical protein